MDVVNYQAIQNAIAAANAATAAAQAATAAINGKFDPSLYMEHQAQTSLLNAASWTTVMSVTGKGWLEDAFIAPYDEGNTLPSANSNAANSPRLQIIIDGNIVLDIGVTLTQNVAPTTIAGLLQDSSIKMVSTGGSINVGVIVGHENQVHYNHQLKLAEYNTSSNNTSAVLTFPNPSEQMINNPQGIVVLSAPIYFRQSLLVQVVGNFSPSYYLAFAKARY